MALTLTYDNVLSRVRVALSDVPTSAESVLVERSRDGVNWTTVRGGIVTPSGSDVTVDDYEFLAGVENYYRASVLWPDELTVVGATSDSDNNASTSPTLPSGVQPGDTLLLWANIRDAAASPNLVADWTFVVGFDNYMLLTRKYDPDTYTTPTVTYTGGGSGDTTTVQLIAVRGLEAVGDLSWAVQTGTGQNISRPGVTWPSVGGTQVAVMAGFKYDDCSSISAPGTGWSIDYMTTTTGDDASSFVSLLKQEDDSENIAAGSVTVTGGSSASTLAIVLFMPHSTTAYVVQDTITPEMDHAWLKFIARPFLNREITVTDWSDIERPSRSNAFNVVGRGDPVAVTEVQASRRFTIWAITETLEQADDLDLATSLGNLVYLHAPANAGFPSVYAMVGDIVQSRLSRYGTRRRFEFPLTEVAAPGPDVVGSAATYQTLLSTYATYDAVWQAKDSYLEVAELIGSPTDIIVGSS
jgi:hypothetical protein